MIDAWLSSSEHTSTPAVAERREHAEVRGEPGGEERARARLPFHVGELAFELAVDRPRADDEPRRARPGAPAVERVVRGRDHGRDAR